MRAPSPVACCFQPAGYAATGLFLKREIARVRDHGPGLQPRLAVNGDVEEFAVFELKNVAAFGFLVALDKLVELHACVEQLGK